MGANNSIHLGIGNASWDELLGRYYQDFSPAITHFDSNALGGIDDDGIPYYGKGDDKTYSIVYIIQYALIHHELLQQKLHVEKNKEIIIKCLNWLDKKMEPFKDSVVWRSERNIQYDIPAGWISAMDQGQAISLYLRAYQLLGNEKYKETAEKAFAFFKYDYKDGGSKRTDENGCVWLEEYPTEKPSYVLNGFIYAMFGALDLYRVTKNTEALLLWNSCVNTLDTNLHKYDVWYWSVYDQLKKQLVSYYYQKNVHIPLMEIMYELTGNQKFNFYANKWKKNLNSPFHRLVTKLMYRVQPRLKKMMK